MALTIALRKTGKKLTPYVMKTTTNGRVQKAFKKDVVPKMKACLERKGMKGTKSVSKRKDMVRECATEVTGTVLSFVR